MRDKLPRPVSRRWFLAATAAAAAPLILTRTSLGGLVRRSANQRASVAVIGTGKQGLGLLNSLLDRTDVQIIAVCDVDSTRRENARQRVDTKYAEWMRSGAYEGCSGHPDHREVMERSDVDAVVIATPDHWHTAQIIDAAKAGKDIYCEKPLTLTIEESRLCIEVVRKYKRVLQTGSQQRSEYDGRFRKACEVVRSGRLGPIMSIYVGVGDTSVPCDLPEEPAEPGLNWDRWLGPAPLRAYNSILSPRGVHDNYPDWRKYREYSGGMMTDWGAHHFDVVQWALGADAGGPVEVIPPEDKSAKRGVRLRYAGGIDVIHGGPPYGILFIGEKGTLYVDRDRIESKPAKLLEDPIEEMHQIPSHGGSHLDDWIACVESRKDPVCSVEVGARSAAVCQLGNLGYWHGRALKWDPRAWEFPGDAEANAWRDCQRRAGYELPTF